MGRSSRTENSKKASSLPRFSVSQVQANELTGILMAVAGVLALLSLVSYRPYDPSLNTAVPPGAPAHNWVGVAGAYLADALIQLFGWVAYLIPVALGGTGLFRLLGRGRSALGTRAVGVFLLAVAMMSLLELYPNTPLIQGVTSGSGLVGAITARLFEYVFNRIGAWIVFSSLLFISLFFLTTFSLSQTRVFLSSQQATFTKLLERRRSWAEQRRKEQMRRKVEKAHARGRVPVAFQRGVTQEKGRENSGLTRVEAEPPAPVILRGPEQEEAGTLLPKTRISPKVSRPGPRRFKLPSVSLLQPSEDPERVNEKELKERAVQLTRKFKEFGVTGAVTKIHPGPVVTTFEFKPEAGIKYNRITTLAEDLCLGLGAESILIERIPGKATVGIQVPNKKREIIHLRELIEGREFTTSPALLNLCLGKNINGLPRTGDLTQMPHLLIAGSTGAGKSVSINSMIVSLLYKCTPEELKLILIDPKHLELSLYEGIPHLYTPIVTQPKQAAIVLKRATIEMEERLKKLAEQGVRSIDQYNQFFKKETTLNLFEENGESHKPLPYIVIIIDELADLMITEGRLVEESITRLAQMARAVGIHLILATQRPSVDIITGLIKANFPCRISFRVASKVDSRTVLDGNGAEALLGRGDMLFVPPGSARLLRLHGPLVTEPEITRVVDWWKEQAPPRYEKKFFEPVKKDDSGGLGLDAELEGSEAERDAVYQEAVRLVLESRKASTSLLQRRFRLGYGRAARLIDMMQEDGIVSQPDGPRPREVLKPANWLEEVERRMS